MPRLANNPDPRRAYQRDRVIAALEIGSLTAQQLADNLHMSRSGAQWHLNSMMKEKPRLVHIAGHARNPNGHRSAPMYGSGDKPDVKCKRSRAPKGRVTAAGQYNRIVKMLRAKQMTAAEVAKEMLLQRARIYVIELHAAGRVHITAWKQDACGAYRSPVYAAGAGQDIARPAPRTEHEKSAQHWARIKADPHRHAHLLQRNRMRNKPQTWLSALMG